MFDLQTFVVYLLLLFLGLILLKANREFDSNLLLDKNNNRIGKILFVLILSMIVGFRFEVGVDWLGYKNDYEDLLKLDSIDFSQQYYEIGYLILVLIFVKLKLSSVWLFFLLAFISWTVIIKAIPNIFLAWTFFFLFADEFFFWSMNGVRQFVALSFWLIAIRQFYNREHLKYLYLIFLGGIFHYSLFIIAFLYFIPLTKLLNFRLYIFFFLITFFIGQVMGDYYSELIEFIDNFGFYSDSTSFRYARYITDDKYISDEIKLGLGFYLKIIINLVVLILGFKFVQIRNEYKSHLVLFFFGCILFNLFYESQIIGRIMIYFIIIRPIILGAMFVYFWKRKQYQVLLTSLAFLYFIFYLASIYNNSNGCSPYNFYLG